MPRKFVFLLTIWFVAGIAAAVALALLQPTGPLKWALRALAIIPVGLLLNGVIELGVHGFMSLPGLKQATRYFEARGAGKAFSLPRAAWYVFATVLGFAVVVVLVVVGSMVYTFGRQYIEQDKCLDRGGQWNAANGGCLPEARERRDENQ